MPRKIKTAFTGSDEDRAITGIHDIGFIPAISDGVKGFEVRVGGGTSIMARVAPTLYDFVEADNGDYLKVAEAVFRIFDRQDWLRVNRARARIKVLVDKIGIDAFREHGRRGARGRLGRRARLRRSSACASTSTRRRTRPSRRRRRARRTATAPSSSASVDGNVQPQRQEGFSAVEVKVTRGDLTPEQFRGLGQIMREFTGGYARTHRRSRTSSCAGSATSRSTTSGSGSASSASPTPAPREITDVVSCPGTDSCKLGHHQPRWASTGRSRSGSRRWRSPTR